MSKLRVIGDIHGCIDSRKRLPDVPSYVEIIQELEDDDVSVQLGDMGFNYKGLSKVSWAKHFFVPGNHENYSVIKDCDHSLGDYGQIYLAGPFEFFFVRGAFSVDKRLRLLDEQLCGQKSWWPEEELTQAQGLECLKLYEKYKPQVVMSHDCPNFVSAFISNGEIMRMFGWPEDMTTSTQELLEQMMEIHQPKLWLFGHYHRNTTLVYKGTTFMCVGERDYVDFNTKWEIIGKSA